MVSMATPIPQESEMGMGPRGGMVGVFPMREQFFTMRMMSLACDSEVDGDLPAMASKFALRMKVTKASSRPGTGNLLSKLIIQHFSHWKGIDA